MTNIETITWFALGLSLTGVLLNSFKKTVCWPVWILSNVAWAVTAITSHLPQLLWMQVAYVVANSYGWYSWVKPKALPKATVYVHRQVAANALPNQLIVKDGKLVLKSTGEAPSLPLEDGLEVNVVPHHDLKRVLHEAKLYRIARHFAVQQSIAANSPLLPTFKRTDPHVQTQRRIHTR